MAGIGVLTTTFYRSQEETRFHLAAQMIGNAVALGHAVLVVDGSPEPAVGEAFRRIGARVSPQTTRGMGPSRRELFAGADSLSEELNIFLWLEPEKPDLIRWILKIAKLIKDGEADIVIPSRTEKGYASCPKFQVDSEQAANSVYAKVTGLALDVMFGPVAFHRKMLHYFARCNPKERYGAHDTYIQHIAPLEAMAQGYRVTGVEVDFLYPPAQKAEEESLLLETMVDKRRQQSKECTDAFRLVAEALKLRG